MRSIFFSFFLLSLFSIEGIAQVRPVEKDDRPTKIDVPAAPPTFKAKYEGGMFGFSKREEGTIRIDDINERIVFYGKDGKEKFSLSFSDMQVIYPDSRSVTSNTGNIVRNIPLPGSVLGGLIKEKWRYMIISFNDADADVSGNVSFKISSKELLESVIHSVGKKAGMTQRGDSYYRPRVSRTTI